MKRVTERADLAYKGLPEKISGCRQFEGEDLSKCIKTIQGIVPSNIFLNLKQITAIELIPTTNCKKNGSKSKLESTIGTLKMSAERNRSMQHKLKP